MLEMDTTSSRLGAAAESSRASSMRRRQTQTHEATTQDALAAAQYLESVNCYAERSKEAYLCSGLNYRDFAQFLGSQKFYLNDPVTLLQTRRLFAHAYVHEINPSSGDNLIPKAFDEESGLTKLATLTLPLPHTAQILFLRGYPAPQWLRYLGAQYRIDPEFFRRHLDFLKHKELYDLPALPSTSKNIVRLRVTTICTRESPFTLGQVSDGRKNCVENVEKHQKALIANGRIGDSIVRKFSVHNETVCTIEQDISFCIKNRNKGWMAFVWLDMGRPLSESTSGPWLGSRARVNFCLPVINHRPKLALHSIIRQSKSYEESSSRDPKPKPDGLLQSASLLPLQYGSFLPHNHKEEILAADAFYAVSELFIFAACAESQFLNMMQTRVDEAITLADGQESLALSNLKYSKGILDEHAENTTNALQCLQTRGDPSWPRAKDAAHVEVVEEVVGDLIRDYEHLIRQTKAIAQKALENMDVIATGVQLQESQTALRKADGVHRLSLLAFFFIPFSTTAAFFGMNVKELGTGVLNIWVVFIILIPVTFISLAVCFWDHIPWRRKRPTRKGPDESDA